MPKAQTLSATIDQRAASSFHCLTTKTSKLEVMLHHLDEVSVVLQFNAMPGPKW